MPAARGAGETPADAGTAGRLVYGWGVKRWLWVGLPAALALAGLGAWRLREARPQLGREAYFDRYTALLCARYDRCCQERGAKNSVEGCQRFFARIKEQLPRARYDHESGAACLATIAGASCEKAGLDPACGRALAGVGQPGDPCSSNLDCAFPAGAVNAGCLTVSGKSFCFVDLPAEEGKTCRVDAPTRHACLDSDEFSCSGNGVCKRRAPVSKACVVTADCTRDAYCQTGRCVPRHQAGESCKLTDECAPGAHCAAGQCAPRKKAGEPCSKWEECETSCDATSSKCAGTAACFE